MFFAGVFSQRFFMYSPNTSCDNSIQTILEKENSRLYFDIRRSLDVAKRGGLDTANYGFQKNIYILLQQIDNIADYFTDILSSDKNLATFSFDTIKSVLGEDTYNCVFDDFYSIENSINLKNNTIQENRKYINFCYNVILRRLFEQYKAPSLIFTAAKCVFHSKSDTVRVGGMYNAEIGFMIQDIQNTYRLEFENGDVFLGNIYTEKAIKAGINERKGELVYLNGSSVFRFPFEFEYYVK